MKKRIVIIIVLLIVLSITIAVSINKLKFRNQAYEVTKVESYNYFVLRQGELSGVIDKSGNVIISSNYEEVKIPNPEKAVFICYKNEDSIEVLNEKNEQILNQYEKVEPIRLQNIASDLMYEKSVLTYLENGKYGLINFNGKKLTKAIYDEITNLAYKEGEMLVKKDGKYGVITLTGHEKIDAKYDSISIDGYYTDENQYKKAGYIISNKTEEGYRIGYIDKDGRVVKDPQYNQLSRITQIKEDENSYLICAENGQYGLLKNKDKVLENEYQSINYDESNSLLVIEKSKKYGVATLQGKILVPIKYNQIDITGIYLYAQDSQGTTIYNNDGTESNVVNNTFVVNTSNEKYKIKIGAKYGLIDKNGNTLIEEKYNYIEYLFDDYFIASNENSKLGIINSKDEVKLEIKYDSLQKVQNSNIIQATVTQTNMTEFYSASIEKVGEMKNANIEINENYIKIYNDAEIKYFDYDAKELTNMEVYKNNKLFANQQNGKWGFVDASSNVKVDYKYDKVTEFNKYGFAAVQKDGKWGSINEDGQEVIAPTYKINERISPSFIGKYYQVRYGFGEIYYTDDNE